MKTRVNLTLDADVKKKCEELKLNMSDILNRTLKDSIHPQKIVHKDPSVKHECKVCGKAITEGYRCEDNDFDLCLECGWNYPMHKCKHDKRGEHFHIKW